MTMIPTGERQKSPRLRARTDVLPAAWAAMLGGMPWQLLVTLTFDPKKCFGVGAQLAEDEARWWCELVARVTRRPIAWVFAVERGSGGAWHAHVLVIGLDNSGLGPAPIAAWKQRNGRIHVEPVRDATVVRYVTKVAARHGAVFFSDTLDRYRALILGNHSRDQADVRMSKAQAAKTRIEDEPEPTDRSSGSNQECDDVDSDPDAEDAGE